MTQEFIEKTAKEMSEFTENCKFVDSNLEELSLEYPNHWIAVENKQVVMVNENLEPLVSELESSGYNLRGLLVDFLEAPQFNFRGEKVRSFGPDFENKIYDKQVFFGRSAVYIWDNSENQVLEQRLNNVNYPEDFDANSDCPIAFG